MRIDLKTLKKLKVETKSGTFLGHVNDLIFEIDGQMIAQYLVTSSMIRTKKYLINRSQVVGITSEKMVVEDGILQETKKSVLGEVSKNVSSNPEPASMIKEN